MMGERITRHKGAPETMGRRVASVRALRGWTQAQLAEQAGVALATIGYVETDRVDPTTGTLSKIARALDVSLDWLAHGTQSEALAATA
jgi:transcriptional regulator with XRE-family HTH domain